MTVAFALVLTLLGSAECANEPWPGELREIAEIASLQTTDAGTVIPVAVGNVLSAANEKGARSYDILEPDTPGVSRTVRRPDGGQGAFFGHPYTVDDPSLTAAKFPLPADGTLSFANTELTPERLAGEMADARERTLFVRTSEGVGFHQRTVVESGTNTYQFDEFLWTQTGPGMIDARSGSRFTTSFVILEDGSIHLMPASRRYEDYPALPLVTPALARGRRVLMHGHLRMVGGQPRAVELGVTLTRRMGQTGETYINPRAVLTAWGFDTSQLDVRPSRPGQLIEDGPVLRFIPAHEVD